MKTVHGGDIYRNKGCLDFSANINPLGMPQSVIEAAKRGVEAAIHYPDIRCEELVLAIAEKEKINPSWVLCGNGAADLIFGLCLGAKPSKAAVLAPSFSEYEQALKASGAGIEWVMLREQEEFYITHRVLKEIKEKSVDMIFLCNPNNPTGQLIGLEALEEIFEHCKQAHILLVIDECFLEFIEESEQNSFVRKAEQYAGLVVIKAFTKLYAMPGIRLGYIVTSNSLLLEKMRERMQPWGVSTVAQAAGRAALQETAYIEETRRMLAKERDYLLHQLEKLAQKVYGAAANYIFFRAESGLEEWMKEKGILIRDCAGYYGLEKGYYRIAIRTREENSRLIECWMEKRREK